MSYIDRYGSGNRWVHRPELKEEYALPMKSIRHDLPRLSMHQTAQMFYFEIILPNCFNTIIIFRNQYLDFFHKFHLALVCCTILLAQCKFLLFE